MLIALVACSVPAAVHAQAYVQSPCASSPPPVFQDDVQASWYRRFWTGDCRGLPLRCIGGKPNWNDVTRSLISRAAADRRADVAVQACRLGREIGFEWSRPNAVRRIDTGDLKTLNGILEKASDVVAGLANVESRVRAKVER